MPDSRYEYGKDYKTLTVSFSPEEHKKLRLKSVELGIALGEVIRFALSDDAVWKKAVEHKRKRGKGGKKK